MDSMFKADPCDKGHTEDEVEESLPGDGENDKGWGKGQEDDHEAMKVVTVGINSVEERESKGGC